MLKRLLAVFVLAVSLTACGSGGVTFTKKIINSDNGVPLIEYTVKFYETLVVFRQVAEDMSALCESGTATGLPASPTTGVAYVVTFTDCVIDGTTLNGSITITFSLFNSWTDMAFTLEFTSLMAEADWFDGTDTTGTTGTASFTGQLEYSVLDADATISLLTGTLTAEVLTGDMGKLVLSSFGITVEQGNNPDLLLIDVTGRGEISNSTINNPIAIRIVVDPRIRINVVNTSLRCPTHGYIKVESLKDGSFASIEYPSSQNNVYRVGTNDSFKQRSCS